MLLAMKFSLGVRLRGRIAKFGSADNHQIRRKSQQDIHRHSDFDEFGPRNVHGRRFRAVGPVDAANAIVTRR